jgi:two-component system LytT family response regulator
LTPLRVMVVDDEPLAREGLAEQLRAIPGVEVVGVHADGAAALQAMDREAPDALFIDIRMPGLDGFDVVAALDPTNAPAVVFVTAYDAFAVKAFEMNAMDYLLKPATAERLVRAVEKVSNRSRTADSGYTERFSDLLERVAGTRPRGVGRLMVREVGQVVVIPTADIDWIEGADYYARLHVGTRAHLMRESLTSLEKRLDPARFLRVHRSAIVNVARVRVLEAAERGDGVAVLRSGARVRVMRAHRAELEKRIETVTDQP